MAAAIHYLLLFAKYPYVGKAKTRLQPALGIEGAHQFARTALIEILRYMGQLNGKTNEDGIICKCVWSYAPSQATEDVLSLLIENDLHQQWTIWPQDDKASSLGGRLSAAIERANTHGNQSLTSASPTSSKSTCTLIGSDCFQLTLQHVTKSMQRAANKKAFILPADDGGYVLLSIPMPGINQSHQLFDNIRWSSEETCKDQMEQLKTSKYELEVGETLSDVDQPEDLVKLHAMLGTASAYHLEESFPSTIDFIKRHMSSNI